jgi:hypothetical protein
VGGRRRRGGVRGLGVEGFVVWWCGGDYDLDEETL